MSVAERTPREVMAAYVDAMNRADWTLLASLLAPDYIEDYPQSGERVRGRANALAVRQFFGREENRSSLLVGAEMTIGGEDRWALAPNFTAIKMTSDGDTLTSLIRSVYPDGPWYVVHIATIRGGLIVQATVIFGAMFEPPEWRRGLVERIPDRER
jgi:SnoaL-like domain